MRERGGEEERELDMAEKFLQRNAPLCYVASVGAD